MSKKYWPFKVLFFLLAAGAFISLAGFIVMKLWNALLPDILGVKEVTMWQSIGILVLSRILFGGWGKFGRHHSGPKSAMWRRKWHAMSDEEKEAFKTKWKEKCGR